jgi:hypothetical protein
LRAGVLCLCPILGLEDSRDHVFGGFRIDGFFFRAPRLALHFFHAAQFGLAAGIVVAIAQLRVLQHLVGAAGLGKALGGQRVVLVLVGMHGFCHGAPGGLDLVRSGIASDAEH